MYFGSTLLPPPHTTLLLEFMRVNHLAYACMHRQMTHDICLCLMQLWVCMQCSTLASHEVRCPVNPNKYVWKHSSYVLNLRGCSLVYFVACSAMLDGQVWHAGDLLISW